MHPLQSPVRLMRQTEIQVHPPGQARLSVQPQFTQVASPLASLGATRPCTRLVKRPRAAGGLGRD